MALADTRELLGRLQTLVSEELKSISYKWLAREFGVPANRAKQILFSFADTHRKQVHATYLLAGWTKEAAQQHVFRLVDAGHLQEAKAQLSTVTSLHVHSVQPSQPKDPADLWNTDNEQTAVLFERMVQQLEVNCLAANSLSAVSCPAAQRDLEGAKRRRPAAAAAAPAQPAKPPASMGAAARIDAIMKEPVGRRGSASASAAHRGLDASGKVQAAGAASAPPATGKGQAASQAAPKAKGSLFNKATARAPPKQAAKSGVAAASIATAAEEGKVASESEDEEAVLPSKRKAGRRAVLDDDSDSETEPAAAAEPESAAAQPRKPAAKQPAAGAGKKAKAAAAEAEAAGSEAAGQAATAADKQKGARKKAAKRPSSQPALGKAKAGAAAGIKRRKVSRTTINEKGEEVTETVWEDEGGDSQAEAPAGEAPGNRAQPAEKERSAAPVPAPKSAPVRQSPQKPAAKGSKGKGKGGGGAGQKSLTSFFSKK